MTSILQEFRFPLHLAPRSETIWALYSRAKTERWDPSKAVDWAGFDPARLDAQTRDAAPLMWSHRAWILFGRLSETPSLLVRFCLERQRDSDPKYFLSLRGAQEAWHLDVCHGLAERLGGFVAAPTDAAYAACFNQTLHREVLDAELSLDAYVGAYVALRDELEVALLAAARAATIDTVVAGALDLILRDKRRHAQFGWLYLPERRAELNATVRHEIITRGQAMLDRFVSNGMLVPGLAPHGANDVASAYDVCAAAGLGGVASAAQRTAISEALAQARTQFAVLGIAADTLHF